MGGLAYEPFGRETWRDPFTLYRRLRDEDPVHRAPGGYWVLTRFEHVYRAAKDTATFSSEQGLTFRNEIEELGLPRNLVMMDPPDHTRYRLLVSRGFTRRQVRDTEEAVRSFTVECIERLREKGEADLVAELARPLPSYVVADYLGVPEEDRGRFEGWTQAIVQANAAGHPMGAAGALAELVAYFSELVERRRAEPGDDMISGLVLPEPDGPGLGPLEIIGYAFVMIAGGNDTTTGLIGGAAELLTTHREQRKVLIDDPSLVPGAVEELLRLTTPVQGLCRVTTNPVTIDGVDIPAGGRVLLCYGAANRDPREFRPDAETLDVTRPIRRLLTFGEGAHYCLGAAAARLQGRVVIEELLSRCPDFVVDADKGAFADGAFVRRYESLPFAVSGDA